VGALRKSRNGNSRVEKRKRKPPRARRKKK